MVPFLNELSAFDMVVGGISYTTAFHWFGLGDLDSLGWTSI